MHHFIAQAPCLVTDDGGWAADYVVRMERLQVDMQEVRAGLLRQGWCGWQAQRRWFATPLRRS